MESFVKLAEDRWTNGTSKHAYQEHKCWVKAIEIVKQGGVADDVCGWKYPIDIFDNVEFEVWCNQKHLKRGIIPNNFSFTDFFVLSLLWKENKGCGVNMKTKIQKSQKLKQYDNFCGFLGCIEEYDEIIEKLEDELKKRKENEAE